MVRHNWFGSADSRHADVDRLPRCRVALFDMPHINIIVSIFHFDGEAAENAIYFETWLEYVAAAAILLTGARLLWRRISN